MKHLTLQLSMHLLLFRFQRILPLDHLTLLMDKKVAHLQLLLSKTTLFGDEKIRLAEICPVLEIKLVSKMKLLTIYN